MGDLTQLQKEFRELASESAAEEEQAKYELTASARKFSRRAKHVVDDKLSFSATLMRAGEVDAANRLLEEVHQDVRVEEAALIEKMNEVKIARAATRERMTRVRLGRMLAVSLAGSMLMGFSALGMAAAGFVHEREQDEIRRNAAAQRRAVEGADSARKAVARKLDPLDRKVRKLLLAADLPVTSLSAAEVRRIGLLTEGTVDVGALEEFLAAVLPSPDLAHEVASRIADQVDHLTVAADEAVADAPAATVAAPRIRKKVQRVERSAEEQEPAAEEPEPSPSPSETEPADETEDDGNRQQTGGDDDDDGDRGGSTGGELPDADGLPLGD